MWKAVEAVDNGSKNSENSFKTFRRTETYRRATWYAPAASLRCSFEVCGQIWKTIVMLRAKFFSPPFPQQN
jgi:hypothetical protein